MFEETRKVLAAFRLADWQQVVLNGGPPCFHVERDGRFCFRAERWPGHGPQHEFTPDPSATIAKEIDRAEAEGSPA